MNDAVKPKALKNEHLEFLDELRKSGVTNMWGGDAYLKQRFVITEKQAADILLYWMDTFTERHS